MKTFQIMLLIVLTTLPLGCASRPEVRPVDGTRTASIEADDAIQKLINIAASTAAAEFKRIAAAAAVASIKSTDPQDVESKTKATVALAGLAGDLEAIDKNTVSATESTERSRKKSIVNEGVIKEYQENDPVLNKLRNSAYACIGVGILLVITGVVGSVFATSIPVIGPFIAKKASIFIGLGLAAIAGGLAFAFVARHLVTMENIVGGGLCVVLAVAVVWFAWLWWRNRAAVREIVAMNDKGIATGAIEWTPAATALANKVQSTFTKHIVDAAQSPAVPEKPPEPKVGG